MVKAYFSKLKLKQKLYLMEFLITIFTMILVFIVITTYQYKSYKDELIEDLNSQILVIESNITAAIAFDDKLAANEILSTLKLNASVDSAYILLNKNNEQFAYFNINQHDKRLSLPKKPDIQINKELQLEHSPVAQIIVNANINKVHARLKIFALAMLISTIVAIAITRLFANLINRQIIDPINYLYSLSTKITLNKNYSQRSTLNSEDEIGELSMGINAMLDSIEQRDAKLSEELEYRKQAEKKLDQLAYFDAQTNLQNRHAFGEILNKVTAEAVASKNTIYLLLLDLDHFKVVNDTLGHDVGDILLKNCADRLKSVISRADPIFRIGGDEFAIILENIKQSSQVKRICERIIEKLSQTFMIENNEVKIGVSIGVVENPQGFFNESSLVKNADIAMYWAKSDGRNTYKFYSKDIEALKFHEQKLIDLLQVALKHNELELYYQPIYSIADVSVIGFEALLRWQQPELGMVSPTEFIPLAESTGLINPIGDWVIATSLKQIREWQVNFNPNLFININLSARQFHNKTIAKKIEQEITVNQVDARTVNFEVTESYLMQDMDATINTLKSLKKIGVRVSIDDFGTGHSSMNYLKRLPVNTIKIDKSFVNGLPKEKVDCAIVNAIFSLAKSLNLDVVAEGIETEAQLNFLRKNHCSKGQGYFLSAPVPSSEIETILQDNKSSEIKTQQELL